MSYSDPPRIVFVLPFLLILTSILEQQFIGISAENSALSEEKLKEIGKIRAELNEALETEQENVEEKGVIVQPGWTADKDKKTGTKIQNKVEVTKERIEEVKALREEINKSHMPNEDNVKQLVQEFEAQSAGRKALGKVVGNAQETETAQFVGAGVQDDTQKNKPNMVDAGGQEEVHEFEMRKLQRLEVSKRRMRETLILKSVEEDFTFNLGDDVQQWAHIVHNGSEYFVGRRDQSLLVVHKESATYEEGTVIEVGQRIAYLHTYSFWNDEQAQTEGITLVATGERVLWYRVNNETRKMELYWRWVVGNTITGLTHFTVEGRDYLVVSTNQSSYTGFYMLNIYQFELGTREFWIAQRMQLRYPCVETTLLDTGRDLLLAVPQNDTAAIFTYNPRADDTDYLRFKLKQHIESAQCESVAGFKMGARSYLAIGGQRPQILVYEQGELKPKTILAHNFGTVELFFPVPVRTYRDDLILLVQHRVDFSTHSLTVLETLIWDGEAFEASIPVPCKLGAHTVYGVGCMLDIQHDVGLKGAAYFRRNDEVSIIVPRRNAESGLFRLHTQLLAKNSEYYDLKEIFGFLKKWVQEQDDLIALAQNFVATPANDGTQALPDLAELDELETPELHLVEGEVGEIFVNDYHWTNEDTQLQLEALLTAIEKLDADVYGARQRREVVADELNFDYFELDSLDVDELFVQQLNGDQFYVQEGILDLHGVLNARELEVLESLEPEHESETLVFDGDIEFESINGMLWEDLEKNLVFTNLPLNLTELHVDGEVVLEDQFSLNVLNSFAFPDDYLWSSGPMQSIVSAEKTFTQTLSVNALEIAGLLNGVNVADAITLTNAQEWRGVPTFAELEVTGSLELNGTTRGRDISNIPNNPSLKDAKQVEGICSFRELHVNGPLLVKGSLDGQPLELILSDVLQRPIDPETVINVSAKKYFSQVQMPIDFEALDGKVSGIPAAQFVPAHTKQDLELGVLNAYIYFANLTLSGLYDGVDIKELLKNAIKIDEPQTTVDTHLYFARGLDAQHVEITNILNGVPIAEGYQTIYEDMDVPFVNFDHIAAKEVIIYGNISGGSNATWNGAPDAPNEFTEIGDIYVDELVLEQGLQVDKIQGINATFVWHFLDEIDDTLEMVLDGKILVDRVIVTGDVLVHKLNEQRFDEDLQLTIIWLNRPNFLSTSLRFSEPINIYEKLKIEGRFNGRYLPALIDDIVFREPTLHTAEVLATKSFVQTVRVLGDTHVEALNGINFSDIATTKTLCNFRGSVQIHGNLVVHDLTLKGALKNFSMSNFNSLVRYERALDAFVVQGAVTFVQAPMLLQDLTVLGDFNGMPNLAQFFDELVYKERVVILKGRNNFTGRVRIDKGAYIGHLNGLNLLALLENIVYANEPQPLLIRVPIIFKDSVRAHNLFIGDSLAATKLNGNALEVWFNDTLRLDQPQKIENDLIFAPGTLDGNSLFVGHLNDIDLSEIITLHTVQNLTGNISFSELHLDGEIKVNGSVNGVDLQKEYANTLMTDGNQHVSTPLTFLRSALVLGNVTTIAHINNDKDLRELATLHGDQHFESPLFFENITTEQVKTKFPVSGINMDVWFQATLRTHGKEQQYIIGNWSARTLNVKTGPSLPSYMNILRPGSLPFGGLLRSVRADGEEYEGLCEKLRAALIMQQKRGYYLKYLERAFELKVQDLVEDVGRNTTIRAVFALDKAGVSYLLINTGDLTFIMKWKAEENKYMSLTHFEAGEVDQVLGVAGAPTERDNALDFVTNKAGADSALRYWRLEHTNLTLLKTYEKPAADLMLARRTSTKFYAVHNDIVNGYDLSLNLHTGTWFLPNFMGSAQYRFVPHHGQGLMFTNGGMILLFGDNDADDVSDDDLSMRDKRTSVPRYSLPLSYQRVMSPQTYTLRETLLKPNATQQTHHYRLADFRTVIGHMLDDLNYRLRLEVNITQLSIPETDLRDEHLLRDSIAVMEEMRRQKIFPNTSFARIELDGLQLAKNPALILAARTAQILWPNIVHMVEIRKYLQSSADEEGDVIVESILDDLGGTVHDVLSLANSDERDSVAINDNTHAHELAAVIARIRRLQNALQDTLRELKREELDEAVFARYSLFDEDLEIAASALTAATEAPQTTASSSDEFVTLTLADTTWLKYVNKNLPALGEGEILSILVRPHSSAPLELLAVTFNAAQVVRAAQNEIVLYLDVLQSKRFQTISAHEPRSLITFQIGAETLFAYVEHCCTVRVLIYRGVQGFVQFARFETQTRVLKIFHVMLQGRDMFVQQPHLVVSHVEGLAFYRFVGVGSLLCVPENFLCN